MSSEFNKIQNAAGALKGEIQAGRQAWNSSKFLWIVQLASGSKGKLGKKLVQAWLREEGLTVEEAPDKDADYLVNGHRCIVKFSTMWESGVYRFQQFRNQNYEYAICLGISPSTAHCWVIKKSDIKSHAGGQHTGWTGKETKWFKVNPQKPQDWPGNGELKNATKTLKDLL